jgi:hypothetical protein
MSINKKLQSLQSVQSVQFGNRIVKENDLFAF